MNEAILTATWCNWSDEVGELLKGALNNCSIDDIKKQVENGADLFKVEEKGELVGYYVLRIDELASGNEGVIVAASAHTNEYDLTKLIVPMIEQQFSGCVAVRIHTARAGLIKKLALIGYEPQEFVMRKNINV